MRHHVLAFSLFLCTCALAPSPFVGLSAQTVTDPSELGFDPARLSRIDTFMNGLVADGTIPNGQTLVMRRGRLVQRGSYGYANLERGEAVRPDAIYRIASQTKAMVTVALMMEYEKGKFLLEDPLSKYLPAFANPRVRVSAPTGDQPAVTEPARSPITIRQLLSHSAGIPYGYEGETEVLKVPFFASLEADKLADVVDRIARRPLMHHPGEGFTYGLGIDVAGRLLEVLSGKSLEAYLTEHLWRPLGLEDSYFYLPPEKHDRLVTLYSKLGADAPLTIHDNETYRDFALRGAQTYFSGGAGSVGTIDDYAVFCEMLRQRGTYGGKRYLAPKTVDLMLRNHIGEAEVWTRKDKFGLGFQLITAQSRYGDQARPGAYTWGGMYCSEYTIDPAEELVMLVYTNVHPTPFYGDLVRKFRVLVYAALVE